MWCVGSVGSFRLGRESLLSWEDDREANGGLWPRGDPIEFFVVFSGDLVCSATCAAHC